MKKELNRLIRNNQVYSDRATVIQTYRVKDQLDLFNNGFQDKQYYPEKHLTCDVRLTRDGTIVYGVYLSPVVLEEDTNGNFIQTVFDGTTESLTGDVRVNVPLVGSYVFINWLDEYTSFVSVQTNTESIIVGSTEGAYLDFYNREDTRVLDLKNADEFNIQLNNGKVFNLKTDSKDYTTLLILLERIVLSIQSAQIVIETDENNIPLIKIETDGGLISIKNDTQNLKDILLNLVTEFETYIKTVLPGLGSTSEGVGITNTLNQSLNNLIDLKDNINKLLI